MLDAGALSLIDFFRFAPEPFDNIRPAAASDAFLPDGIALDANGRVWIADAHSPSVAIYDPATHLAAIVPIDDLHGNVYALAIAPDQRVFACVAPRMNTWVQGVEFPSRLVRLDWPAASMSDATLQWQASL